MVDNIVSAGSLRNLEVRLSMAIDAALQAETDLASARDKAGLPAASRSFYLGAEHRVALAEATAVAKPKPTDWRSNSRYAAPLRRDEPSDNDIGHPQTAILAALAAVQHPGLDEDDFPSIIRCLACLVGVGRPDPSPAMLAEAQAWADAWAGRLKLVTEEAGYSRRARKGFPQPKQDAPAERAPAARAEPEPGVVLATAAEVLRCAAIARGEVTPLPTDPKARAIVKAAAKRRGVEVKPL